MASSTYAIHINTLSPVYLDSDIKSKQTSQLLFGELCRIKSHRNAFLYIESNIDRHHGWVYKNAFIFLTAIQYERLKDRPTAQVAIPLANAIDIEDRSLLYLPAGSFIHDYDSQNNSFYISKKQYQIYPNSILIPINKQIDIVESIALRFINAPFQEGGKSILGFDMQGYIQLVYSLCGFQIPRNIQEQVKMGVSVYSLEQLRVGDIIFVLAKYIVTKSYIYIGENKTIGIEEKVKIIALSEIEKQTSSIVIRRLV